MIPLLSTIGAQSAISLRDMLMGIPYVLCVIGIIENAWKNEKRPKALFSSIIVTLIIATLLHGFPVVFDEFQDSFKSLRENFKQNSPIEKLYSGEIPEDNTPSKWDIGNFLCYVGVVSMQSVGILSIKLIEWFQEFAINGLIAVSPILLGFLAISFTRNIGINFLMTSLGVGMWHLGFAIVDLVLYHFSGQILAAAGLGTIAAGTVAAFGIIGWPWAFAGMLLVVIVSNALYLSVPFVVQALLRGANPATTALAAGLQGTTTAIGMGVGAKFALGQLAAQPASSLSGTKDALEECSSPESNKAGDSRKSTDGSQSNHASEGISSSDSSVPSPPPTKPFTAKAGDSVSHGDFTATQTNPNGFTLANNKTNTLSEHAGNIGAPQDLMAGINMHDVKAKQSSPAGSTSSSISQQRQELDQQLNS